MQTKKRAKAIKFGNVRPKSHEKEDVKVDVAEEKQDEEILVKVKPEIYEAIKKDEEKRAEEAMEAQEMKQENVKTVNEKIIEHKQAPEQPQINTEARHEELQEHALQQRLESEEEVKVDMVKTDNVTGEHHIEDVVNDDSVHRSEILQTEAHRVTPERISEIETINEVADEDKLNVEKHFGFDEEAYEIKKNMNKSILWHFFLVSLISFVVGLATMAAVSYFPQTKNIYNFIPLLASPTPTPTAVPTSTPSPTAKPVDLSAYKIKILNGSGVRGAAAGLKETLAGDGFEIASTGNADLSDYTETIISAKKEVKTAFIKKLKESLSDYKLKEDPTGIENKDAVDVIIILGSSKVEK